MAQGGRRARDHALLDALDAFKREPFAEPVWRVAREGRDPLVASPSRSRWCNGDFDVLYTSLHRDGAMAEVHALLSLQPVFPSGMRWQVHELAVAAGQTLRLADLPALARLGVDVARYGERDYARTQEIADAAFFLGFDGLVAPSARWDCLNAILFATRIPQDQIAIKASEAGMIDWEKWRAAKRPRPQA